MDKKKLKFFLVDKKATIKDAIRVIDKNGMGVAFVTEAGGKLFGVATDGDIRRGILRGINVLSPIEKVTNKNPVFLKSPIGRKEILAIRNNPQVRKKMPLLVPIVNSVKKVIGEIFLDNNKDDSVLKSPSDLLNRGVKKVLVVGGAGYLGSVICRELLNKKYKVKVLDNLIYGDNGVKPLYANKNFEFIKGDIRNISDVVDAVRGVDAVIHLAAIVGDPACAVDPEETLEINYLATKNIVETCKYFQINRFIFASTCSVYGASSSPGDKLTEDSALNPVSLYAETKIECEKSILEAMDENFSPTILRMATLYGYSPNMRFDLAVNIMTGHAVFDKKITVFGGDQWRPWLHISDAAQGFITCLKSPLDKIRGEVFNILSENYKIIDVANIIKSVCKKADLQVSKKITDKRDYNVSFGKIARKLNYQPKIKLKEGVSEIKKIINNGLIKDYKEQKYRATLPQT
jgi:nucleoside-diphosphate-sugar epimerase